ncbi:nitrogenase component 1 [Pectinatus frisingensis]|uniref:nitrogenase component 1 n=1 Tax=Pectinatus frisingensis TaxID=865 RepID=UPI0018C4C230|nr:nitrogenase component 1 [Pectinatus frisingensis]
MGVKTKRFIMKGKNCSCSMPGVWRALVCCKGAVVIFHSPRACAQLVRSMEVNAQYRVFSYGRKFDRHYDFVPLISTQMEERDSIFGGTERLLECIQFVVDKYQPECIAIGNSCIAGVIGDDVETIGDAAARQFKIPIITVSCYGFLDGEYYQGYFEMAQKLLRTFARPCRRKTKTVVLLGDNGGPWGHYAQEVAYLLNSLGIKILGQFPGYTAIAKIKDLVSAKAVVVLGSAGQADEGLLKLAELFGQFGVGQLPRGLYPIGWTNTQRWILALGELFNCREAAQQLVAMEGHRLLSAGRNFLPVTSGKRVILCIGRPLDYFNPALIIEIIKVLDMNLIKVILLDDYSNKEYKLIWEAIKHSTNILICKSESLDVRLDGDLILTTHELKECPVRQIFLPMLTKAGIGGMIDFMREIYRAFCHRGSRGGITYVW